MPVHSKIIYALGYYYTEDGTASRMEMTGGWWHPVIWGVTLYLFCCDRQGIYNCCYHWYFHRLVLLYILPWMHGLNMPPYLVKFNSDILLAILSICILGDLM